ncbi:MAG: ClpXP protease specificity-enhancing factor [Pseudomonadota bacterium]|jgi:stringent starvation protein B|nr:ClpXP protease specificity-enhancing factor [Pseudomonadota bacterium]
MAKSRRPYLIRAIYEWAADNGYTPHLVAAADADGVVVPREFVQDGRITLNVSMSAVQGLDLHSDPIYFSARFSGRAFDIWVPSGAVLAIFAKESGEGIVFGEVEAADPDGEPPPQGPSPEPGKPAGRSHLRVVK